MDEVPAVASISANVIGLSAFTRATQAVNQSLERLSTGKKINRASDDPSGLISVTNFKVRETELNAKLGVIDQQTSRLGAIDGATSVLTDQVLSLQSHVLAAANSGGLSKGELEAHQTDVNAILDSIDFLSQTTVFKGEQLLKDDTTASLGGWNVATKDENGNPTTKTLSLKDLRVGGALQLDGGDLETAQTVVKAAVDALTGKRASNGAAIQGLQSQQRSALSELEEITKARSDLEDTDFAAEASNLIRGQTQQQAAQFVIQFSEQQRAKQTLTLLTPLTKTAA
ncbi:MAG: flagellin [Phycisphaerales bacterium]